MERIASTLDPMRTVRLDVAALLMKMDQAAVAAVLRNLFDNAVKYAWDNEAGRDQGPDQGPEQGRGPDARLSVTVSHGATNLLVCTVADNGKGLPPERLKLFNGEVRAEQGRFGVMAIRSLLLSRGGWLRAENAPDGGARISFAMPGAMMASKKAGNNSGSLTGS